MVHWGHKSRKSGPWSNIFNRKYLMGIANPSARFGIKIPSRLEMRSKLLTVYLMVPTIFGQNFPLGK